jgi:hypothetical protein
VTDQSQTRRQKMRRKMRNFLVVFSPGEVGVTGTAARLDSAREETAKKVEKVKVFIRKNGLDEDLGVIGAPTALGAVGFTGTSRLAKKLREIPMIEDVVID